MLGNMTLTLQSGHDNVAIQYRLAHKKREFKEIRLRFFKFMRIIGQEMRLQW